MSLIRDLGDGVGIEYVARNPDTGALVDATVALQVTDPAGTVTNPTPTHPSVGRYQHTITVSQVGLWRWKWTVTGAVTDIAYGEVQVLDRAPGIYASLDKFKRYLLGSQQADLDTVDDEELDDILESVSREIDDHCGRMFWPTLTATPRLYGHDVFAGGRAWIDDFYTTDGLIVATDDTDDGTYATVWTSGDFQLEPLNGVVRGVPGWPYHRILPVADKTWPRYTRRAPLKVTARWGWAAGPPAVRSSCLILAAETHKLRQAPLGVAGFGEFGVVRVRDNPIATRKLRPFVLDPAKVL